MSSLRVQTVQAPFVFPVVQLCKRKQSTVEKEYKSCICLKVSERPLSSDVSIFACGYGRLLLTVASIVEVSLKFAVGYGESMVASLFSLVEECSRRMVRYGNGAQGS